MDNLTLEIAGIIGGCDNLAQLDYAKGDIVAALEAFGYGEDAAAEIAVDVICEARKGLTISRDKIRQAILNYWR